ncbi:(protein release factor)-glutamine N5-methyltransferase [Terriglobus roseus DSM 18391]|uniref:Release factor glutamine methyltransferase n=1 Tax=Terriglobus roseus (strain DSM 18391 / NRRL B-41598 / KBS 63) TaxID=926566 RepID=I3ZM65_TERRK|nr:peptide chain release factor N(5)-glutamine methyltransferase [Terriglobus roseus]AFL90333.1 (protein release factor)-glutamine N5-methyltransferase [Terriglobus roseus DSM 18391]
MHDPLTIKGATVQSALRFGTARLEMSDDLRENAARDAQQILEIATGLTRVQMMAQPDRPLREEEAGAFQGMIAQRRGAVPIQHLRGSQEFFGRDFFVSPDVLIPRPETEHIIEEVLRLYPDRNAPLKIVDVGTGSGILAITLALEYPQSTVTALDISPVALREARANAARLGADRVVFLESDLMAAVAEETFDLIVSNPPYIPQHEASTLHRQVLNHEPHLALFGGADGLDVLRRLIPQASQRLVPGGWLLLETAGRSAGLDDLLKGWKDQHYVRDLQDIERIACLRAPISQ